VFQKSVTNAPCESRQSLTEAEKDPLQFAAVCSKDCTQTVEKSKRGRKLQTKSESAEKILKQQKHPSKRTAEPTAHIAKRTRLNDEDTSNPPCLYCHELFATPKAREKWIQCSLHASSGRTMRVQVFPRNSPLSWVNYVVNFFMRRRLGLRFMFGDQLLLFTTFTVRSMIHFNQHVLALQVCPVRLNCVFVLCSLIDFFIFEGAALFLFK
jgi:hypothetical protein